MVSNKDNIQDYMNDDNDKPTNWNCNTKNILLHNSLVYENNYRSKTRGKLTKWKYKIKTFLH